MVLAKIRICETVFCLPHQKKAYAPGEARTHGLQIMRLTRCLLRYRGWLKTIGCLLSLLCFLAQITSG